MSLKPPGISTASLTTAGLLVPSGWEDVVASHGADPTGVSDSTTAIQAAIDVLPDTAGSPRGGTVYFPPGKYKVTAPLVLNSTQNFTLRGPVAVTANDPAATAGAAIIRYTTGDSSSVIDARSTQAFAMEGLAVTYSSASYTGKVVDLSHDGSGSDSQHAQFRGCMFGGDSATATNATALIWLKHAIFARVDNCYFGRAVDAIRGREDNGAGGTNYSNSHTIRSCQFARHENSIVNAGDGWVVDGCGFEGTGGFLQFAYLDDIPDANNAIVGNLTWTGNWMGDAISAIPTYWMDFGFNEVRGLVFVGNLLSQKKAMIFRNGGQNNFLAASGMGSDSDHLIDLGTGQHKSLAIIACDFSGYGGSGDPIKNRLAGHYGKAIIGNRWPTASNTGMDELIMRGGHIGQLLGAPAPTVTTIHANAGSGASCTFGSGSTDLAGRFTLTTGSGPGGAVAGLLVFTHGRAFDNAFSPTPNVVISPNNVAAAGVINQVYPNGESVTGWQLGSTAALAATTAYVFNYHIFQ